MTVSQHPALQGKTILYIGSYEAGDNRLEIHNNLGIYLKQNDLGANLLYGKFFRKSDAKTSSPDNDLWYQSGQTFQHRTVEDILRNDKVDLVLFDEFIVEPLGSAEAFANRINKPHASIHPQNLGIPVVALSLHPHEDKKTAREALVISKDQPTGQIFEILNKVFEMEQSSQISR